LLAIRLRRFFSAFFEGKTQRAKGRISPLRLCLLGDFAFFPVSVDCGAAPPIER
jgi:hypothetical protein